MINILSNFRMPFLSGSQKWVCESVVNYSCLFVKVMLNIVFILVLSLSNVLWRILKLQEAMCKRCMEGMLNSLNTDVPGLQGNKLKRRRHHIIEYMMKPKTKRAIDFSTCNHDTKEDFQEESDFTYLKKSYREGLRKAGKAHSL